ncbi:MAG: hypothetical protein GWM87_11090, partial [Xanthomonadales bacterium]|nr:hypothetical protein [Xanthomonadales bacterium]NIX13422.1 hypothetical protein [Xanthomonadales bacterium]
MLGARNILGRVCGTLTGYFDEPCPPEEAERLFREECEIRGDTAAGWACRHRFKAQFGEEGEDNYPELLRWLELEPTSFGGNFQAIFHVWREQDDPVGGLARFDTLRALYPDDLRPAGGMSNLLRNTGRLDEVLAWRWGSFRDQLPEGNPWSLARLGTDYLDLGMYERALEVGLMTRDTRRFSAIHFVPNLWAGMGELELAAQEWEWGGQALVEAAGSPRAWIQTARFLVDYVRDHARAKELFDLMIAEMEMAELCEGDPDCLVELPLILAHNERALGNEDQADKWLLAAR